jgi:hypothetical protein
VEAWSRDPRMKASERDKVKRGSAASQRETAVRIGTDSLDAQTPGAAIDVNQDWPRLVAARDGETARGAGDAERRRRLPERENLCRQELKGVTGMKQGRRGYGRNKASGV